MQLERQRLNGVWRKALRANPISCRFGTVEFEQSGVPLLAERSDATCYIYKGTLGSQMIIFTLNND